MLKNLSFQKLAPTIVTLSIAVLCLAAPAVAQIPAGEKAGNALVVPELDGTLKLRAKTPSTTSGIFGRAGSLVTFKSAAEGDFVHVELQVNSVVLEATRNVATGEVTWTGHESTLFPEDRIALIAFARKLQGALELDKRALSPHEDLLHRVTMLWAEAPAGFVLRERTVAPVPDLESIFKGNDARPLRLGNKACYVGDNNGIAYISCSTANRIMCHDQDGGGHCWTCFSVPTGCGANCLSECGPGCAGLNIWTLDCGDHDDCCRVHGGCINPFDGECGDEYGEASDDFLLGFPNCSC